MSKETAHQLGPYLVFATSRKNAIARLRKYLHIKLSDQLANRKEQQR